MRTNIDIDDKLMNQAMRASKTTTKKAAVEAALRTVVRLKRQEGIRKLRGKIQWEGDLAALREGRFAEWEGRRKAAESENADVSQFGRMKTASGR
jgi:Arc/MetJ family transcription regulator